MREAAPSLDAWRAFLAATVLATPAACVVARVDADAAAADTWLPALAADAALTLAAHALPSGAGAGVDGVLVVDRAAGVACAVGEAGPREGTLTGVRRAFSFHATEAGARLTPRPWP